MYAPSVRSIVISLPSWRTIKLVSKHLKPQPKVMSKQLKLPFWNSPSSRICLRTYAIQRQSQQCDNWGRQLGDPPLRKLSWTPAQKCFQVPSKRSWQSSQVELQRERAREAFLFAAGTCSDTDWPRRETRVCTRIATQGAFEPNKSGANQGPRSISLPEILSLVIIIRNIVLTNTMKSYLEIQVRFTGRTYPVCINVILYRLLLHLLLLLLLFLISWIKLYDDDDDDDDDDDYE
jgi:hypothetical protein